MESLEDYSGDWLDSEEEEKIERNFEGLRIQNTIT